MKEEILGLRELLDYFKHEGVHTCLLYGSAAAGRLRSGSDIDLAIAANNSRGACQFMRNILEFEA